jgi:hypothetical protein
VVSSVLVNTVSRLTLITKISHIRTDWTWFWSVVVRVFKFDSAKRFTVCHRQTRRLQPLYFGRSNCLYCILLLIILLFLLRAYVISSVTLVHRTGKEIVGSYRPNCASLSSVAMGLKARNKRGVVNSTSLGSLSHFRHSASYYEYFTNF